jgi:hypothetical protein
MVKDTNLYRGKVEIALKRNNKILKKSTHNAGLPDMALLFAKAITGNISPIDDLPRLLDIGYVVPGANDGANSYDNGVWMSILNSPVNIGGRQYRYDGKLDNWVGILTSTVYAADLNNPVIEDATQKIMDGVYILKARLCSYNKRGRKYLAEIEMNLDDITEIREKTSAIFTWYTELLYAEPDSSDSLQSDVSNSANTAPVEP